MMMIPPLRSVSLQTVNYSAARFVFASGKYFRVVFISDVGGICLKRFKI